MVDITIRPDAASLDALNRSMDKLQAEMKIDAPQAVKFAAIAVGRSWYAATRIAPKHRPVEKRAVEVSRVSKTGRALKPRMIKTWGVLHDVTRRNTPAGTWRPIPGKVSGKREAQDSRLATIRSRGLAKMAVWWSYKKSGFSGMSMSGTRFAVMRARDYGTSKANYNGTTPSITLTSTVSYAVAAVEGGAAAFSGIFQKAARGMIHRMRETMKRNGAK